MSGANINYNQIVSFHLGLWMFGFVIDLSVPEKPITDHKEEN